MSKKNKKEKQVIKTIDNKKVLNYYAQLLKSMDFIPKRGFVEIIDRSDDSIANNLDIDSYGLVLSKDLKEKEILNNKKIIKLSGDIKIEDKKPILYYKYYKDKSISIDKLNMYLTDVKIAYANIELITKLISECNKFVFIGTYGLVEQEETKNSIEELYKLKGILTNLTNKSFEGTTIEVDRYYVAAITPKLVYKKKS